MEFIQLPNSVVINLMLHADDSELKLLASSNIKLNQIYNDNSFWMYKLSMVLGIPIYKNGTSELISIMALRNELKLRDISERLTYKQWYERISYKGKVVQFQEGFRDSVGTLFPHRTLLSEGNEYDHLLSNNLDDQLDVYDASLRYWYDEPDRNFVLEVHSSQSMNDKLILASSGSTLDVAVVFRQNEMLITVPCYGIIRDVKVSDQVIDDAMVMTAYILDYKNNIYKLVISDQGSRVHYFDPVRATVTEYSWQGNAVTEVTTTLDRPEMYDWETIRREHMRAIAELDNYDDIVSVCDSSSGLFLLYKTGELKYVSFRDNTVYSARGIGKCVKMEPSDIYMFYSVLVLSETGNVYLVSDTFTSGANNTISGVLVLRSVYSFSGRNFIIYK